MKNKDLRKNGSGCNDPTAYKAITNIEGKEEKPMEICKGEIYEYTQTNGEVRSVLVASSEERKHEKFISMIALCDEPKGKEPVSIVCGKIMYADCNMLSYGTRDRFGKFIRKATDKEMQEIEHGLIKSLGLKTEKSDESLLQELFDLEQEHNDLKETCKSLENQLKEKNGTPIDIRPTVERDIYKELYEQLLEKMLTR